MTISKELMTLNFAPDLETEIKASLAELRLSRIAEQVAEGGELTPDTRRMLLDLISALQDIFNVDFPAVYTNLKEAILKSGRDIALSRLLREKGLFRLYTILYPQDGSMPEYLSQVNPDTQATFKNQEELLGWFCREAHVSRSMVFGHMKIIRRLLSIDMSLQESFHLCLTKLTAVEDTLAWIADWEQNQIIDMDPYTVQKLVEKVADDLPQTTVDNIQQITALAETGQADPMDLAEAAKPAIRQLLKHVGEHGSVQDAKDYVRHDVLGRPEIHYRWDPTTQSLLVDYIQKAIDPAGVEYITNITTFPFSPSTPEVLPEAVVIDLTTRLPIRNRKNIDI